MDAAAEEVPVLSGYESWKDYPRERYLGDEKSARTWEGTNEIMRLAIARDLLRNRWDRTGLGMGRKDKTLGERCFPPGFFFGRPG